MSWLFEGTVWPFVFVVLILGGGAAYMTGRAIAGGWQSYALLAFYCFLLALVSRFLLFALFERTLTAWPYVIVNFVILGAFALLGHRRERTRQMVSQYGWLNERTSPLSWRDRNGRAAGR